MILCACVRYLKRNIFQNLTDFFEHKAGGRLWLSAMAVRYVAVSIVMGVPLYRWMVYFDGKSQKCMITGGSPILGNLYL